MIECNLCGQRLYEDDVIEQRKKRHEEKHTRGWNHRGRENGGGNNTIGKVTWIDCD